RLDDDQEGQDDDGQEDDGGCGHGALRLDVVQEDGERIRRLPWISTVGCWPVRRGAPAASEASHGAPRYQTRAEPAAGQASTVTLWPMSRLTSALRAALTSRFLSTPVRRSTKVPNRAAPAQASNWAASPAPNQAAPPATANAAATTNR